jgi:rubrerythrin
MRNLGLGVTISVPGHDPVDVTAWLCPDCGGKRKDGATPCPTCGSMEDAVLR